MEWNKLESITLIFENCEEEVVSVEALGAFSMEGITKELNLSASNEIMEFETVSNVLIRIKPEGNVTHKGLLEKDDCPLFDRLQKWSDITQIGVLFSDNIDSQLYFVKYKDGKLENNQWQYTWIDELGNMWIVISPDKEYLEFCTKFSKKYFVKEKEE